MSRNREKVPCFRGETLEFLEALPKNSACHRSVNDLPAKICQPSPHLTSVKIGAWLLRANNLQPKKRGKTTGGGFNPAKIFSIVKLAFNCPNYITQNTSQKKCFKSTVSLNSMFIYYCFLNQNCIHHFHLHPNAGGTAAPVVPPPSSRWLPEILKRRVVNNTTSRGSSPQGPAAKKQGGKSMNSMAYKKGASRTPSQLQGRYTPAKTLFNQNHGCLKMAISLKMFIHQNRPGFWLGKPSWAHGLSNPMTVDF